MGDFSDYKSQGYLTEKSFAKPERAFRILGLGDSFAVCDYHLQKNYHNYLAAAFKNAGYEHIEVLNAGIPGVGPAYYWHILEKYGDAWKPDLVLVGFFVGNDFEEFDLIMHRGPFIREPRERFRRWLGYLQFRNFWVYKVVKGKLIIAREKRNKSRDKQANPAALEGSFSRQTFLEIEKDRMRILERSKQAGLDGLWRKNAPLFLKFQEWCDRRQVPLVIAVFPDQFQVDPDLRQEIYRTYRLDAESLDLAYPNRLLSDYCRRHRIYCLDLLAGFQKEGANRTLYKLRDSHWNEAGNRLAGELIFNYLQENRLVRPRTRAAAPGGRTPEPAAAGKEKL